MKIDLNQKDIEQLNLILEKKQLNILSNDFLNVVLEQYYDLIEKQDFITNDSEKEYFTLLMNKSDISLDKDDLLDIIKNNKVNEFKKLNYSEFQNNPYLKNIQFDNLKQNKFVLKNNYYSEYECFLYDEPIENNFSEINQVGYFEKTFNYPVLNENNITWMSVTPYEINTMKNNIESAKGQVLTLGLGLGYFAFMVSNKKEVNEVFVVEKNKEVIELFKQNILPQFPNKNKIKIINDDAFNYLKNNNKFDYVFFDIHHNEEEGLLFLLELIDKKIKINNLHFWINKSILFLVRRYLLILIEEYFQGYTKDNYKEKNNTEEKVLSFLYEIYSDTNINSINDIYQIIDLKNIEKKLYSFFF